MTDLKDLCMQAVTIVNKTGEYIRKERLNLNMERIEHKSSNDLVSYVDQTAERMLVEKLGDLLPEAGFITEEGTIDRKAEINWIIDPLDGTNNYLKGYTPYSTTIALVREKEPLLGITLDIPAHKCYYAWKDGGCWCNHQPVTVSAEPKLQQSLVVIGFPYHMGNREEQCFKMIQFFYNHSLGIRISGSAAIDLIQVACGNAGAYVQFGLKPWDVAAGYLLVREAGGKVSTFEGKDDLFRDEIIASGKLQDELLRIVGQYMSQSS